MDYTANDDHTVADILLPGQLGNLLSLSTGHLAQMRYLGTGPKFIRVTGKQVRYRMSDVQAWLDARTCSRSDERPQAAG